MGMKITLKLFASYREAYNRDHLELEVAEGTTCAQVQAKLAEEKPELTRWQKVVRYGLNQQFVGAETTLQAGDELVLIPPVSGG
jgi:sulfur-carrier protein